MDRYLELAFASPNDSMLLNCIYLRVEAKCDDSDEVSLSRPQQVVFDIWGASGIIGNGGFQYLFEGCYDDFSRIAESYQLVGADRAAEAVRSALALFPESKPHRDVDERLRYLHELGPTAREKLEQFSRIIWSTDRETRRKLAAYVRSQRADFARLKSPEWEDLDALQKKNRVPPPNDSSDADILAWLESIDGRAERWSELSEHQQTALTRPATGDPIVQIELSSDRSSTDQEIQALLRYASLRDLRILNLTKSRVTTAGLHAVVGLSHLEQLQLEETDLDDDSLGNIAEIKTLRALDLSRSQVTGQGLAHLVGLSSLRELSLAYSPVTDSGLEYVGRMTGLTDLDLSVTQVCGSGLHHLANLPNLTSLRFFGNQYVRDETLSWLRQLRHLTAIDLCDTAIGDSTLEYLAGATELDHVSLSGTAVTDAGLKHLSGLLKLTHLYLESTNVSSPGMAHLAPLSQLKSLHLFRTDVDDAGIESLSQISGLRELSLSKTKVTDAALLSLSRMTNLTNLSLDDTKVSGGPGIRVLENLKSLDYLSLPKHLEHSPDVLKLQRKMKGTTFSFR